MDAQNQVLHANATPLKGLVNRLEAATSRLEDIASSAASYEENGSVNGAPASPATTEKGVPAAAAGVAAAGASPTTKPQPSEPPMIRDFDTLLNGDLAAYGKLSNAPELGGLVGEQVRYLHLLQLRQSYLR